MSAVAALTQLRGRGVEIMLDGDDLVVVGADQLSDSEVERLRLMKGELVALLRAGTDGRDAEGWRAFFKERAAIAACDGGLSRPEADAVAFNCCIVEWLNRHPIRSCPDRCCWCNKPEREDSVLLPFGVESAGHAWLHSNCWRPWHEQRIADAVAALAEMGMKPSGRTMSG
jgi:hypothetical protein